MIAFDKLLSGSGPKFKFVPDADDLSFRMGLKPMGRIFDTFLAITAVIAAYSFYERLHLIWLNSHEPFSSYLQHIFYDGKKDYASPIKELLSLFTKNNLAFDLIDLSSFLAIILVFIPILVVCFLPLWRIKKLVESVRDTELATLQEQYREAHSQEDNQRAQFIQHRQEYLKKANVWPNGDSKALSYLRIIASLALGAIAPPLFALIVVFVGTDIVKSLFKSK